MAGKAQEAALKGVVQRAEAHRGHHVGSVAQRFSRACPSCLQEMRFCYSRGTHCKSVLCLELPTRFSFLINVCAAARSRLQDYQRSSCMFRSLPPWLRLYNGLLTDCWLLGSRTATNPVRLLYVFPLSSGAVALTRAQDQYAFAGCRPVAQSSGTGALFQRQLALKNRLWPLA